MLGTHNSLSFVKPQQWWLRPFSWMAKCQSLNIEDQWKAGARYFDIRVKVRNYEIISSHGLMTYDIKVVDQLYILDKLALNSNEECYIRFVIEDGKNIQYVQHAYEILTSSFVHLNFLGLISKPGWVYIEDSDYSVDEIHSYKLFTWKDFLCPKYWAKKFLKKNLEINHSGKYLILDFIELYRNETI